MAIKDLYQDSRYPMEKVAFVASGSVEIPDTIYTEEIVVAANTVGVPLMIDGVYSIDNWQTTYPLMETAQGYQFMPFWWDCEADTIKLTFSTKRSFTMQYRLWAYVDEDIDNIIPTTSNVSESRFIIQNKNYMKIFATGVGRSGDIINHNLGYIPFVKAWAKYEGGYEPSPYGVKVDENKIEILDVDIPDASIAYRIYINEA